MTVGNIVSNTKINVSADFNVVKSLDEIIQGLPTLIVGWDKLNSYFHDYNVLTRTVNDDICWTFKKNEKRDLYEEDLYYFTKKSYENLVKDIIYLYIDPIVFTKGMIKKIYRKLASADGIITYHHDNMLYIYCEKIVFGLDLDMLKFIGIDVDKTLNKIRLNSKSFLEKNVIFIEYNFRMERLDNQVKYIPYLYKIEHE